MLTLHLGLPKTGTTWLQERIFPKIPELNVIYKKFNPEFSYAIHRFLRHGEWRDPVDVGEVGGLINQGSTIFTDENVSVSMQGIWTGKGCRPAQIAENIPKLSAELGGCPVRVMITVRRQDTWLASRYAESAKQRENPGQEEFEEKVTEVLSENSRSKRWLLFDEVYRCLAEVIDADNMLFLCQEAFVAEPRQMVERVCRFLEVSVPRTPALGKKHVNRLSTSENTWGLKNWDGRFISVGPELSRQILEHFRESNSEFARLSRLDLASFGYFP